MRRCERWNTRPLPPAGRAAWRGRDGPPPTPPVGHLTESRWIPGGLVLGLLTNPALAQVPRAGDADKVWALVRVWSDWAGDPPTAAAVLARLDRRSPASPGPWGANLPEALHYSPSAYLQQVKRIAPPELIGRETELAELAAFCLDPDRGPYVWWQAEAWAGKSALLSTFVMPPPPELQGRVRIVSFFITARLAAQDTREAFVQVMLEQLAEANRAGTASGIA